MNDNGLERFKIAQKQDYNIALKEIKNGLKVSHWIWYIFPQLDGITKHPSYMNKYYSLNGVKEAKEYYNDELLRNRLVEISSHLYKCNSEIEDIVGFIDARKIQSCMTLFYMISNNELFKNVIDKFYNGEFDDRTLDFFDA